MWLLAIAASVGLHVETVEDVELEKVTVTAEQFAAALETATSSAVVVDSFVWTDCKQTDRCVEQIRVRTRADDVVMLKFFGGLRSFRLSAERIDRHGRSTVDRADLPLKGSLEAPLEQLARALFPSRQKPPPALGVAFLPPPTEPERIAWAPFAFVGVAVGAAVGATIFRVSAANAANTLEGRTTIDGHYDRLDDRRLNHTVASNVLFTTAAISVAVAVGWWLLD